MMRRRWTGDEDATLRHLYPMASWPDLRSGLPGRNTQAIRTRATLLGLHREVRYPYQLQQCRNGLIRALVDARLSQRLSRRVLAEKIGVSYHALGLWEVGTAQPLLLNLEAWVQALGLTLRLEEVDG